jgi:aminopeptidase YwaD
MRKAKFMEYRVMALTASTVALSVLACSDQGAIRGEEYSQTESPLSIGDVELIYDGNRVRDVMQQLVDLGPRVAGSAVEQNAAEVLRSKFESFGLSTTLETSPVTMEWKDNCGSLLKFKDDKIKPIKLLPLTFSPHADITAPIVHVERGYPNEYPVGKSGYIALIRRGTIPFAFKVQYAFEAGAVAAVIYNNVPADGALPAFNAGAAPIPIANVTLEDGNAILSALDKGPVIASMHVNTERVLGTSRNVVATLPGTDTAGQILYMTAHYDSAAMRVKFDPNNSPKNCPQTYSSDAKKGSPGANDNASGVGALVEAARVLTTISQTKATIKFIAFSGEEVGLSGSLAYVLAHRTEIDTHAIGVVNLDMIGDGKYLLFGNASSPPELMEFAIGKAATISELYIPTGLPQQSDHAAFEWRNVPAMSLTRMIGETPNPYFFVDYPYYHQQTDTMDKVSVGLVESAGEFATLVAHDFAEL